MKIQPFGERVAIQVLPIEEVTEGGLVLSVSKEKSNRGEVVALGDEVPECISLGDKVLFNKGAGLSYSDGSEDYRVISVKDVLCKIIEE